MATIRDVAKAAGVSVGTVSNILNGKNTTRGETWQKVQQAIQDLNYRPNFSARNLKSNRVQMIGVVLPRMNQFYMDLYNGIVSHYKNTSCMPLLKCSEDDPLFEKVLLDQLLSVGISGLILIPASDTGNDGAYQDLIRKSIPVVLVEREVASLDCPRILFHNEELIFNAAASRTNSSPEIKTALVRLASEHTSERDAMHGFLRACPEDAVHRVSQYRNEMFSELLEQFSNLDSFYTDIFTTSPELAYAVQDVCKVMHEHPTIHALSGNQWSLTSLYRHIRPIRRASNHAGILAARTLSAAMRTSDRAIRETIYVPNVQRSALYIPDLTTPNGRIRILCLESKGIHAVSLLSRPLAREAGIKIEFDRMDYPRLKHAIEEEISGRSEGDYDILMVDKPWLQRCYNAHLFEDLGKELSAEISKKYPQFIRQVFYENRFRPYCIPFIAGVQALYYRSDLFNHPDVSEDYWKDQGIPLAPPTTWQEYNRIAQYFTGYNDHGYSFSYGTMLCSSNEVGLVGEFLPRQWFYGGSMFTEKKRPKLDSVENERALRNLAETFRYTDPLQFGHVWDMDIFASMLHGKVPMAIGFANHYHWNNRSNGKNYNHFIRSCPLPGGRAMVGGYLLGIRRGSKNVNACRSFLQWIMSDTTAVSAMRMGGYLPGLAVYNDPYLSALNPWLSLIEQSVTKRCTRETIRNVLGSEIMAETLDSILNEMIIEVIHGADSREALKTTNEKLTDLVLCR